MKPWERDWAVEAEPAGGTPPWERDWGEFEGPTAKPERGGFTAAAKQAVGSAIRGAGQAAADFIPGVGQDNPVKRYGQEVIDANPTAVNSLEDIAASPGMAAKEATGNAAGSMAGMLGARAAGMGITAMSPLAGPAAPLVAGIGQIIAWVGPAAIAALPSYGGIRDKQILTDPAAEEDAKAKAVAALGAATVGAIETKFGPQQWALSLMTREGRAQIAKKLAETGIVKGLVYGAGKGAAIEGAEELVQNPIEQAASFQDPTSPESVKETIFGGAMGAIGGGVLGGGMGTAANIGRPKQAADILDAPDVDSAIRTAQEVLALPAPGTNTGETILASGEGEVGTAAQIDAMRRQREIRETGAAGMGRNADIVDVMPKEPAAPVLPPASPAPAADPATLIERQAAGDPMAALLESRRVRTEAAAAAEREAAARREAELAALPEAAAEQSAVQAALQRAGSTEGPTAMQAALERAMDRAIGPEAEPAPAAPAQPPLPRIVERTPEMVALPQKLAEQRAAATGGEVVRIRNQNGKFAFTVIPRPSAPAPRAQPEPAAKSGGQVPASGEPAATWFGRRGDGYLTQADAALALPTRERRNPELRWLVERMPNGKFRLAGYAREVPPVEAVAVRRDEQQTNEGAGDVRRDDDMEPVRGLERGEPAAVSADLPAAAGTGGDVGDTPAVDRTAGDRAREEPPAARADGQPAGSVPAAEVAEDEPQLRSYEDFTPEEKAAYDKRQGIPPGRREEVAASLARQDLTEETETGVRMFARSGESSPRRSERDAIRAMRFASEPAVRAIVGSLTANWNNGPKVHVAATTAELPGEGVPADVRGLYMPGNVYVVAGAHKNGAQLRQSIARTLAHEAIAHWGLRDMLGREGWYGLMRNIKLGIKAGNKELRRIQQYVRETYVDEAGNFNLNEVQEADEIAAKAVEEAIDAEGNFKPGFAFLKSVWARVAQFLRDHGIDVQFTNAELQGMLVLSMRNMEAGNRTAGGGQLAVAAAREDGPMQAVTGEDDDFGRRAGQDEETVRGEVRETEPGRSRRNVRDVRDGPGAPAADARDAGGEADTELDRVRERGARERAAGDGSGRGGSEVLNAESGDFDGYSAIQEPTQAEAQEVQAGIEGKSAVEAAEFVAANAPSEGYRAIAARVAARMRQLEAAGSIFNLHVVHVGDNVPATMAGAGVRGQVIQKDGDPETHIWIQGADVTGKVGTSYETVLHELVHAATQKAIDLGEHGASGDLGIAAKELDAVWLAILRHIQERSRTGSLSNFERQFGLGLNNAIENRHELIAWALTNAEAQAFLESVPYKNASAWSAFVAAIRRFLGMAPSADTALSEVLHVADKMLSIDAGYLAQEAIRQGVHMRVNVAGARSIVNSQATRGGDFDSPMQARSTITGNTNRQYTAAQRSAMRNVGFETDELTLEERAKALWKDAGKKMAQGIVDQFAPVKDLDRQAYGLLRLSKGASGAFEVLLRGGKLKLTDGVYDFDQTDPGGVVEKLLIPLQGEHHDFFRWIAANRAERLMSEGREHLFTTQDIAALKTLASGTTSFDYTIQTGPAAGTVTRDRTKIYADSQRLFNQFNKNVLDLAEQSGLIDGASRKLWEHEFYVPFYRVMDDADGGVRGMNIKGGMVRQQAFKHLKGGKESLNADLLDNTLMNWAHLLDAAAKNRAAKATIEAAERMGVAIGAPQYTAQSIASATANKNGIVWFMDGGVKRFFVVDDPFILTAITALEYAGMRNPVMNAMSTFKHVLTVGVTASPFFKVRNLIRDSVQVLATSPIGANPLTNVAEGFGLTKQGTEEYFRLLAGGGTIRFGTMLEGSEAKRVQALVESGVKDSTILNSDHKVKAFYRQFVEPAITAYNELGNRGESVNRASLYAQLRRQGMSHAEASLQARDLMDFSMQGSWTTIRFLTQVVPFLNARLQGLYKLGRGAKEDPARFAAVLGATTLFTLSLWAAYSDDDDWDKRELWDRQNFWWFKFGGIAFRIPKPFEIGAIATLAEHGADRLFGKMDDKQLRTAVLKLLSDQLAMNPVPQLVKPVLDVYSNKDSFSGRPIETMGMERLQPQYRLTDRTSMTARALGSLGGPSPVQVDHLIRGYFGWLGSFVVGAADVVARPLTDQPKHPTPDYWKAATGGMVANLEDAPSRYVSQMYEQAKEIEQAYGTWRALQKQGKTEEAKEFFQEHRAEIVKAKRIGEVKRAEARLNERIRIIERSSLDPDEKRDRIRKLQVQKDRIARTASPA